MPGFCPPGSWMFSPKTFSRYHKNLERTYNDVVTAAEGFITIVNVDIRQDNKTTISGLVSSQ